MKLQTNLPKDLLAQTQNLDAALAERVLTALQDAKGSARTKRRDLEALLKGCDHVSPEAAELLQAFIDGQGEPARGVDQRALRAGARREAAAPRELPPGQISGADIDSAYACADQVYRTESLPLAVLRQTGAPEDMLAVLDRADQLGAGGDGRVSVDELQKLERTCALLPDEKRALKSVWRYMEASRKVTEGLQAEIPWLGVEDQSIRPERRPLEEVRIKIATLPAHLQNAATRAAMIARGCGTAPETVTLADLSAAIEGHHEQSTPADREQFAELCAPVQAAALEHCERGYRAKAQIPELGRSEQPLLSCGALKITLKTDTQLGGAEHTRGFWHAQGTRHGRNQPCVPAPRSFPPPHRVQLEVTERHQLGLEVPPGFKLVMQRQSRKDAQVFDSGDAKLPAGEYTAYLMRNGRIVQEAKINVPRDRRQDVSQFYGFELETRSGQAVGLTNDGAGRPLPIRAVVGHANQLGSQDHPVTLEAGLYEGKVNDKLAFALEVLPGNNLTVHHEEQQARLHYSASDRKYVGNFGGKVFRFDPRSNQLSISMERIQQHHGSTSWSYSVKSGRAQEVSIDPKMRIG